MEKPSKKTKNKKQTHLHQQDKLLNSLPSEINLLNHLTVIYLHNNNIKKIEHLDHAKHLKSLYLQKNKISKIENLSNLLNLQKLFLGHNEISVVENLSPNLQELHIEKQQIKPGESLCFDPRAIIIISASLQVLNVSENNLKSIECLEPLHLLRVFLATNNKISKIENILKTIQYWFYLFELNFIGNPVAKTHRYKESIIGKTTRLEMLDNREVSETTRQFMKRFENEKNNLRNKPVILTDFFPNLPTNYSQQLQKAVSSSIIQTGISALTKPTDSVQYLPWKACPSKLKPKTRKK